VSEGESSGTGKRCWGWGGFSVGISGGSTVGPRLEIWEGTQSKLYRRVLSLPSRRGGELGGVRDFVPVKVRGSMRRKLIIVLIHIC